jgi:hypothetical protein
MAKQSELGDGFKITHELVGNQHCLTITPQKESKSSSAVTIIVHESQWNGLRYSFVNVKDVSTGVTKLFYRQ